MSPEASSAPQILHLKPLLLYADTVLASTAAQAAHIGKKNSRCLHQLPALQSATQFSMVPLLVYMPKTARHADLDSPLCALQALYQLQRGPMLSATGGHPDERALLQGLFINAAPQVRIPPPQHSEPPKPGHIHDVWKDLSANPGKHITGR